MKNFFPRRERDLERFNTNLRMRVPIIASYLFILLILKELFGIPFPLATFFVVSFMLFSSVALAFYFDRLPTREEIIINAFFFYTMLDLFLLTVVIYYLGGVTWLGFIFYSFYLILNFMTFSRKQAISLTIWIVFLYLLLVLFQYFQILPFSSPFLPGNQNQSAFPYVFATGVAYISTFILVAYYSDGFYQLYAKKISGLRETKEILDREKNSLQQRIEERIEELGKEREGLQARVEARKKELEKEERVLQERREEMERFKKITLGREKKLKELSRELERF